MSLFSYTPIWYIPVRVSLCLWTMVFTIDEVYTQRVRITFFLASGQGFYPRAGHKIFEKFFR